MTVTSGFYVRSLCHDLGVAVGSVALMAELERTRQGQFELGNTNVLEYDDLMKGEDVWGPKLEAMIDAWEKKEKPTKWQEEGKRTNDSPSTVSVPESAERKSSENQQERIEATNIKEEEDLKTEKEVKGEAEAEAATRRIQSPSNVFVTNLVRASKSLEPRTEPAQNAGLPAAESADTKPVDATSA